MGSRRAGRLRTGGVGRASLSEPPTIVTNMAIDPVQSDAFSVPLYTLREAAEIVATPPTTLHTWARGTSFKGPDGAQHTRPAIVTTTRSGRGAVVPFVGLAEAYVLAAFRRAGVPMQRIRPALARLEQEFGLPAALTSERLKTDGAEVLWDYGQESGDGELADGLVVVRNGQHVFRDVVERYLSTLTYEGERVSMIRLPQFGPEVIVDPRRGFGAPVLASRAIRVADIRDRVAAGEGPASVADDYGVPLSDVLALIA